jgi:beta-lactamase class A
MSYRIPPTSIVPFSLLFAFASLAGCAASADDDASEDNRALTGEAAPPANPPASVAALPAGTKLRATADVELRKGPSNTDATLVVAPSGSIVTVANGAPSGTYYQVTYNDVTGWANADQLAPAETFPIEGEIKKAWERLGGEARFGLPLEAERPGPGGTVQHFQKGCIGPDGSGELAASTVCEEPPDMDPVLYKIWQTIKARSNRTSTAMGVQWLPTKQRWSKFGDERHVSASSPKWSWAMAAVAKKSISAVEAAAVETFKTSNNGTAGQLIDLAGGIDAVNDFTINKLGIPQESFNLCYWGSRKASSCSHSMGADNFFTPNGVLSFLEKAWARAGVDRAKGDKVLEWALVSPDSGYGGWLGTQLPASAQAAMYHKAGWLPPGCCSSDANLNNMNEIGIIVTPRGPYAVSILLDKGTDYWGAQQRSMEWASCVVYHAFAKDAADPFAAGCVEP